MKKRKSLSVLGETELEVLQHVWTLGKATVAEVQARVVQTRPVAYTTVMTVMKNLADKGYLHFEKDGATYVYSAARSPESVRHGLLSTLLEQAFQGSPAALVQTLVQHEPLTETEKAEIRHLIDQLGNDHADPR
jgi:predicted transcriptional regulator